MLTTEIKNKIQLLWDRLWAGGLSNPITAIEQISYLLFMKRLEKFSPNLEKNLKWSTYNTFENEKLVRHIKEVVFEYIKNNLASEEEPFAKALRDSSFIVNNPSLLKDCIVFIDSIYEDIEKQEKENNQYFHDIQGDVYEYLLKHTSEAGKNGQFRTPRHIIQMMTEILDPDVDGKICDLACGSGGFLIGAYQYIVTKYSAKKIKDENGLWKGLDGKEFQKAENNGKDILLRENTFYGFDIDQTMVRIGMMNLMMHGITKPNIEHIDTLSLDYEKLEAKRINESFDSSDRIKIENKKLQGQYKYILANPPFTGKINSETVSENLDRIYPIVHNKKSDKKERQKTVQSELLFLERMIYMLEDGGKACVVVPEGLLFNTSSAHVSTRKILMHDCDLQGVISLPSGVFQPYTGVKTSILIFEKKKYRKTTPQEVDVWFYEMKSDGYTLDTNRKKLKENPLPESIKKWNNRHKEEQSDRKLQYFAIPFAEIQKNKYELNLNRYKDFEYQAEEYRLPKYILDELFVLEEEIFKGLSQLKESGE
ncbi:SAM-dependent methyltransferase [Flavobacterium sp. TR2]|uniref:HsdM family class I SAM-dependent methyltransferase n=1 Tax=Flavobacterium sp. TR2 TaxID=2977321 RepID=UPI0021B14028|nr:SAM-dependent methyltransferase [Flavobacterium sp. TR2]UWY27867.1 SAM-dependent methyltransferase [Flavobacterium sp. TR2]